METRDGLNNHQVQSPESQKVTRLVAYLLRLATLRTKLVRDIAEYGVSSERFAAGASL